MAQICQLYNLYQMSVLAVFVFRRLERLDSRSSAAEKDILGESCA